MIEGGAAVQGLKPKAQAADVCHQQVGIFPEQHRHVSTLQVEHQPDGLDVSGGGGCIAEEDTWGSTHPEKYKLPSVLPGQGLYA